MVGFSGCKMDELTVKTALLYSLVALSSTSPAVHLPEARDYCERDTFIAACSENEVIIIHTALYGRMRVGGCITGAGYGNIGCKHVIRSELDSMCSGRHHCEVKVASILDKVPEANMPCLSQLRGYLEASYSCVPVTRPPEEQCTSMSAVNIRQPSNHGYIASITTEESSCGNNDHPWILSVPHGQTIKLTLHDYSLAARAGTDQDSSNFCTVYAVIKETAAKSSTTVCAQNERSSWVLNSETSTIEVRISKSKDTYFLFEYKVIGCQDIAPPTNGWVERMANVAVLGCNATRQKTWRLTCQDGQWDGQRPNCSNVVVGGSTQNGAGPLNVFTGSQWAAIVIILAIAVTLGLIIFMVGMIYLRRKRSRHMTNSPSLTGQALSVPDYYSTTHPHYSKATSISASDGYSTSMENDYYRTWQLQRHQGGGRPHACPMGPPAHGHPHSPVDHQQQIIEHVYESPKFERKIFSGPREPGMGEMLPCRGPTQYFELDPSAHLQDGE